MVLLAGLTACRQAPLGEPNPTPNGGGKYVTFNIAMPGGEPVVHSRAEIQTSREKAVARLDVYMFDGGTLERVFENVTLTPSGTGYTLSLELDDDDRKDFLFVANNIPGAATHVAFPASVGTTLLSEVKAMATPAIASATAFLEPYLMMTCELTNIKAGENEQEDVALERIMARFDIRNNEPVLTIKSFEFLNTYDRAHTFPAAGDPAGVAEMSFASRSLPAADNAENDLIQLITTAGVQHFKHIIYTYSTPSPLASGKGPTIVLKGTLSLPENKTQDVTYTIPLKLKDQTDFIEVKRNYCYTIEISRAISDGLEALLIQDEWNSEEIIGKISAETPGVAFTTGQSAGSFAADELSAAAAAESYSFDIDPKSTEWTVSWSTGAMFSTDFSGIDWVSAAASKTDPDLTLNDRLTLTLTQNDGAEARTARIRVATKVNPSKYYEFLISQTN